MEVSVEQEINQLHMGKPHVVILGAGASYAAFPKGDRNGARLPLMNNLVDIVGLSDLIAQSELKFEDDNFETIYDQLYQSKSHQEIREELENVIYDYFSSLDIVDEPTIYDHLLLSLRGKDVVATFNWDPFLLQAYRRNAREFELPRLLFLHGNVAIGFCEKDRSVGINGNRCSKCGCIFERTKLLYPISEKNYHKIGFISSQWNELDQFLRDCFMITIYGYGAPQSDVSAIGLMKSAWGDIEQREMEQTEIIDIKCEDDLCSTWKPFIHSHHYDIHPSFYESWISNHPRRTGEAYLNQYLDAMFIENNPIPRELAFPELWDWYDSLKEVEESNKRHK